VIRYPEIQEYLKKRLVNDKQQRYVNVSGSSLEDALKQASIELSLPIKRIEYEVLDPGSKGMLGMGKKPCLILAYPAAVEVNEESVAIAESDFDIAFEMSKSRDGKVFIRRNADGVYMKISEPEGDGVKVTEKMAMDEVVRRDIIGPDKQMISKLVKKANNLFVKIADFRHDPTQDALVTFDLQDLEMKAFITIRSPGEQGADPDRDSIRAFLQANGVVFGYLEKAIQDLCDSPVYGQPILVAEGQKPVNGEDGKIIFNFETDTNSIRLKEIDGKVDYHELNKINNVVAGQVLAKMTKPTRGEAGQTVTGKLLPAKVGKPTSMEIGNNVRLSDDGTSAIAEQNGQVILLNGKISVEPIYVVNNGVDLKTGNILFLGTVLINGNVEDGFSVKAAGNIEITGSVGKCELDAEGDIIIRQGMNGRESGSIQAGGNVFAKFIQNTKVDATGMVVVSDGIINSQVSSDRKILCKGRRASIVGGNLRAAEEINAKALGSVASVETILEVGFDPKSKARLEALLSEERELHEKLDEIKKNVATVESALKAKRKISDSQKEKYGIMKQEMGEYLDRINEIEEEKTDVHSYLAELKANGKISASGTVFPGVKVNIKDANLDVRNEFKAVTFVNDNGQVKVTKYEEIEDDISLKPKDRA
jgi:uncharacterized protein (DUF342 family)